MGLQADLYMMHTPHGISLTESFGVYGNMSADGNALWNGEWSEFSVNFTVLKLSMKTDSLEIAFRV